MKEWTIEDVQEESGDPTATVVKTDECVWTIEAGGRRFSAWSKQSVLECTMWSLKKGGRNDSTPLN